MKGLKCGVFLAALVVCSSLLAASVAGAGDAQKRESLTNADVIELQQLGLGEEVMLEKIKGASCSFDVSIEGLRQLKAAGVPTPVISEMIRLARQTDTRRKVTEGSDDPAVPHEPGIYYYDDNGTAPRMVLLEPAVYTAAKSGGFLKSALTYGIAKMKSKAVLPGSRANFQIQNRKPVFYFYFETIKGPGLGQSGSEIANYFSIATSANEFVLVKTDVKKNSRELIVGEVGALGAGGGVESKAVQPFDFEKVRPGVYKVVPRDALQSGEYCFFYGGNTAAATYGFAGPQGGGKVFDFGVSAPEMVALDKQ